MRHFKISGKQGFIHFEFTEVYGYPDDTSFDGGYDVQGKLSIQSGNYFVKDAELWFTTGQIYTLFQQMKKAYSDLKGEIVFSNRDTTLKFKLIFKDSGHIDIRGEFQELLSVENRLLFEFESEQSYLISTLDEMKSIVDYYGDLKGIKK